MIIDKQVCSLAQALRLRQLGVTGASTWRVALNEDKTIHTYCYVKKGGTPLDPETLAQYTFWETLNVYTVPELGVIIGKGTDFSQAHWQWLSDCVNSGLSGTVAYNPVALCGFVITYLENNPDEVEEVNNRLNA